MTGTEARKRIRHKEIPGHARALTFSCHGRKPLLRDERVCALLGDSITRACERHAWRVIAFVFMPEHVHLLVRQERADHRSPPDMPALLRAIKQSASYRYRRMMSGSEADHSLWLAGPGYDRNITMKKSLDAAIRYIHANPVRRGLCASPGEWLWSSWRQWHEPKAALAHASIPRVHRDW